MDREHRSRSLAAGDTGFPARVALGALALAAICQWLFFDKTFGVSVPLFVVLLYAWFFSVAGTENRSGTPFAWGLLAAIFLLALTYALFSVVVFRVMNVLAIPLLAAFHAALHTGKTGGAWYRKEAALNVLRHLVAGTLVNIPVPFRLLGGRMEGAGGRQRLLLAAKIAAGLALAFPIVLIVTVLLVSADRAFERVLLTLPGWWADMNLAEWTARGFWTVLVFFVLFGFVWSLLSPGKERAKTEGRANGSAAGTDAPVSRTDSVRTVPATSEAPRFITVDPVIVHTMLAAVNLVYLLFAVVQFSYLFGAWDGVLPDGRTYAEHARSGFFELVAVSIINYGLLAAALVLSRPERNGQRLLQRWLLTALMAGTLVMLVSAHVRLSLYEDAYGYSVLRYLVHAFLVYMAALLMAALWRIWREGVSLVRLFALISLAAWLAINYAGVDRQVAEWNIARYEQSGDLDALYLTRLSDDAVPALLPLAGKIPEVRENLQLRLKALDGEDRPFVSFNVSRYRAHKLLENELR